MSAPENRPTSFGPRTSKLRSLALAVVMLSTTWLLLADSAEECGRPAEHAHVKLSGACAAQLFVERNDLACFGQATAESGTLQFDDAHGYIDLHDEALPESDMGFDFRQLQRTDGTRMENGYCTLSAQTHTYSCRGCPTPPSDDKPCLRDEDKLVCEGSYEVIQ